MMLAPATSHWLAQVVAGGDPDPHLSLYDPRRLL
jgi:glycine/D-amino acid oxidase-like deaminating enzyme